MLNSNAYRAKGKYQVSLGTGLDLADFAVKKVKTRLG